MPQLTDFLQQAGLTGRKLQIALKQCEQNLADTIEDLRNLAEAEDQTEYMRAFPQAVIRQAISAGLKKASPPMTSKAQAVAVLDKQIAQPINSDLPSGKRFAYFASHKKSHTRFGDSSADLARATKDIIKLKAHLDGYFDVDNLRKINKQQLREGIVQSCSLLLYLNDETLDSPWTTFEVNEARRYNIPIIVVVDVDKQLAREVIDLYMERGFSYLFDEQVITYSTQGRDMAIDLIIDAIRRGIQHCHAHDTLTATEKESAPEDGKENVDVVHDVDGDSSSGDGLQQQLKDAVVRVFGSARACFEKHSKAGSIGKKQWKRICKKTLPSLSQDESKQLRKLLPNKASAAAFSAFIGETEETPGSGRSGAKASSKDKDSEAPGLARLPPEVPELPPSFRPRADAQSSLTQALLAATGTRSTTLTAPKSRISSQGMGGVGKTMLTAAVIRSEPIRAAFAICCWVNLSQLPEIVPLQRRLFEQIAGEKMSLAQEGSIEFQVEVLSKQALGQNIILILDDIWDKDHEPPFNVIDPDSPSKLLVTTRIKGILGNATEVELELLGVQESVELLAAVSEIDSAEIPPVMVSIAQCCGRLPLCLNIIGRLIKTVGTDDYDDILAMLKTDMKSLKAENGSSLQPLNLQQRVIQSGLDSLQDDDAQNIVMLFHGMAVFAEDQVFPVAILSVLWVSIDPDNHKPLSVMKARQWVSQLLSRSILLGSSSEISMHDLIRDFILGQHTPAELQQRQRQFVQAIIDSSTKGSGKAKAAVRMYADKSLSLHVKHAVLSHLGEDSECQAWLLSDDDRILNQILLGLSEKDLLDLAQWYTSHGDHYHAARTYWTHAQKMAGVSRAAKVNSLRAGASAMIHVDERADSVELECQLQRKILYMSSIESEADSCCDALLATIEDESRWSKIDTHTQPALRMIVAEALLGFLQTKYTSTVTLSSLGTGSRYMLEALVGFSRVADRLPEGQKKNSMLDKALLPFCIYSIMGVISDEVNAKAMEVLGPGGDTVTSFMRSGGGSFDSNKYAQELSRNAFAFADIGHSLQIFLSRFADASKGKEAADRLEEYYISASEFRAPGSHCFGPFVVNALPMMFDPAQFAQVAASWELDSVSVVDAVIDTFPLVALAWNKRRESGVVVSCNNPDSAKWLMKLLLITNLPRKSAEEATEVLELVASEAPENSAWFNDTAWRTLGMGNTILGPCLAVSFGEYKTAKRHARAVLSNFHNPVKLLYANLDLGKVRIQEKESV